MLMLIVTLNVFDFDNFVCLSLRIYYFSIRMSDLRSNVMNDDDKVSKEKLTTLSTGSYGYGGKFGVEKDRMDKVTKLGS